MQVFDGLAKLLEENLLSRNEEPEVLVATNINPKLVGGNTLPHVLKKVFDCLKMLLDCFKYCFSGYS